MLTLYIDGDAFPNMLKPILLRAVERLEIPTVVIANKRINIGESAHITAIVVGAGADEADDRIVELLEAGDLVITADIPLADRVITKQAHVINHRGELLNATNIKHCLAMRNLMQDIRDNGEMTGGPAPFAKKYVHDFANQLDKFLIKSLRKN
ncbi:MAG: YaiI/YqxD family protein [Victivallaceae bacterium]|nr:YaiI/YqxD family protein [Victivallaceae bacterium]